MSGRVVFIAGVGDTDGYGWAVAQAMRREGATVVAGCWPPAMRILERKIERLRGPEALGPHRVLPLDVDFPSAESIPQEVAVPISMLLYLVF